MGTLVDAAAQPVPHQRRAAGVVPFAFAAHGELLLASGGAPIDVPAGHGSGVSRAVRAAFLGAPAGSIVCGVVPFDPSGTAELRLTHDVRRTPWTPSTRPTTHAPVGTPDDPEYRENVAAALRRIAGGAVDKVVLARTVDHPLPADFSVAEYFTRLAAGNPHGWTFAVRTSDGVLTGASPELVAAVDRRGFSSHPLAGSRPRAAGEVEPPQDLLDSAKDQHEHGFVVGHIADRMAPLALHLDVPAAPTPTPTDSMWHLGTRITGTLRPGVGSLDAALRIHPTPAVCGTPTDAALDLVRELEPRARGFYAGLVGWTDADGHGEWALVLRCAVVGDRTARLSAGAGIVAGSTPEAEHAETAAKFVTALGPLVASSRSTPRTSTEEAGNP